MGQREKYGRSTFAILGEREMREKEEDMREEKNSRDNLISPSHSLFPIPPHPLPRPAIIDLFSAL